MTPAPLKRIRIIWLALVVGVATYTMLIWGLSTFGGMGGNVLPPQVMSVGGPVAIAMMAGALVLRRTLVSRISHDLPAEERVAQYSAASLVGLAIVESAGLFVITLGLMSGATPWILAGGGAAALLMVTARPRESEIGLD